MKKNNFKHKITKEELSALPLAQFEGDVFVIDKPEMVDSTVKYLRKFQILGVDTETKPSFVSGQHFKPALLQIATQERAYLFRLNVIGLPQEVADILANPNICKVGIAFKDDLNSLRKHRKYTPQNYVDLQKIVLNYGILDLGMQKMFGIIFGQRISKAQRLTNWENEVLTAEQQRYAATDAWATLQMYLELKATEMLPQKDAQALRQAEIQRLVAHQQQVLAERALQKKDKGQKTKDKGQRTKDKDGYGKNISKKA